MERGKISYRKTINLIVLHCKVQKKKPGHVLVFCCERESKRNSASLFFLVQLNKVANKRKCTRHSFVSLVSIKVAFLNLSSDLEGPDFCEVWNTVVHLSLCHSPVMKRLGACTNWSCPVSYSFSCKCMITENYGLTKLNGMGKDCILNFAHFYKKTKT